MKKDIEIEWLDDPEKHDYAAAQDYLELIMAPNEAAVLADKLDSMSRSTRKEKKAKDIVRAAALPMLGEENYHVRKNIQKMRDGKKLSPILLVVDNGKLIIADGYHRVCAVHLVNEDAEIPCRIVWR